MPANPRERTVIRTPLGSKSRSSDAPASGRPSRRHPLLPWRGVSPMVRNLVKSWPDIWCRCSAPFFLSIWKRGHVVHGEHADPVLASDVRFGARRHREHRTSPAGQRAVTAPRGGHGVVSLRMLQSGLRRDRGLAACNTRCPWRPCAGLGDRGCRDLEGFACCCVPMLPPPARTWRAGCSRAALPGRAAAPVGLWPRAVDPAAGRQIARLRPQRARCGSCGRTHILLPSWCAPRRADAIEVIGTAAAASLAGAGYRGSALAWASRPRPCAAGCAG